MKNFYTILIRSSISIVIGILTQYQIAYSQCFIKEVSLTNRVSQSEIIIEGKVTGKESFWDDEHRNKSHCWRPITNN